MDARDPSLPPTFFAPPERAGRDELRAQVAAAAANPIIDGVLHMVGGLIAVVNEHRQVIALNQAYLQALGVTDVADVLGLRLGEAVGCVHCAEHPAGCGTGPACARCGLVIAMLAANARNVQQSGECVLSVDRENGRCEDLDMRVVVSPLDAAGGRFLLVFLEDASDDARRAGLERAFFHDVNNLVTVLVGVTELLTTAPAGETAELTSELRGAADRLRRELAFQRALLLSAPGEYPLDPRPVWAGELLLALDRFSARHPSGRGRVLHVAGPPEGLTLQTDPVLSC